MHTLSHASFCGILCQRRLPLGGNKGTTAASKAHADRCICAGVSKRTTSFFKQDESSHLYECLVSNNLRSKGPHTF